MKTMTEKEYRAEVRRVNRECRVWAALTHALDLMKRAEEFAREDEAKGNQKSARVFRKEARTLDVLLHAAMESVRAQK